MSPFWRLFPPREWAPFRRPLALYAPSIAATRGHARNDDDDDNDDYDNDDDGKYCGHPQPPAVKARRHRTRVAGMGRALGAVLREWGGHC